MANDSFGGSTRTVDYAPMLTAVGAGWTLGEIAQPSALAAPALEKIRIPAPSRDVIEDTEKKSKT